MLRTRLVARRAFWVAYAIIIVFQLISNGMLTYRHIVRYNPGAILGLRIAGAPVEDLLFGFSLVLQTLELVGVVGRRSSAQPGRSAPRPRRATAPGPATASRRVSGTATRRSSTW